MSLRKVDKTNLIGIEVFEGGLAHKKFVNSSLEARLKILQVISPEEMGKIVEIVGGELVDCKIDDATEWTAVVRPLHKFEIYYFLQKRAPEFENAILALYSKDSEEIGIPAEDVATFTILCNNAFIYAAKKIKANLPKISRYL